MSMTSRVSKNVRRALRFLDTWGVLLLQDPKLPSLVAVIAGGPIRGSWWGHPQGSAIFHAAGEMDEHPDVASTKLISGKVTFVHRRYWPLLMAIGRSREDWQMKGLSTDAQALLKRIDKEKRVRASGRAAKELETALLVAGHEVHTESGAHAMELWTWRVFASERNVSPPKITAARARAELEELVATMNEKFEANGKLPWRAKRRA